MEPPWWYYPVSQSLGAALYRAGRYDEARQAFTAALAKYPGNGWALYGLASSEQKLGRRAQAAAATAALNRAWMGDPKWLRMERICSYGACAAMNFSTTGAIFSRHLRPLKMP